MAGFHVIGTLSYPYFNKEAPHGTDGYRKIRG